MISKTGLCVSVGKLAKDMEKSIFSRSEIEQYQLAIDLDDYHEKRFGCYDGHHSRHVGNPADGPRDYACRRRVPSRHDLEVSP